jgi:hypothetical protein
MTLDFGRVLLFNKLNYEIDSSIQHFYIVADFMREMLYFVQDFILKDTDKEYFFENAHLLVEELPAAFRSTEVVVYIG